MSEESHHTEWEEFRRQARDGLSNECTNLLKRMELLDSDDEGDLPNFDGTEEMEEDAVCLSKKWA